jgi:hypothetical protein
MTIEKRIAIFAAWIEVRAADQAARLHAAPSTSEARQRLRTEAAELHEVQTVFDRPVLAELAPVQRALLLAGRDMRRSPPP